MAGIIALLQLGVQTGVLVYMWNMMDNLTDPAWLFEKARGFSFEFDKMLVPLASKIYNYYEQMLNGTLITPELVEDIMGRLYVFVGIAILFRLAIALIKYIVSPETFYDTKAGAGNLVKRIVLGCVIIAILPLSFNFANRIQSAILSDRIIEKALLPPDAYADLKSQNLGNRISMLVFQGLFTWNPSVNKENESAVWNEYEKIHMYSAVDISSFPDDYITEKASNDEYIIDYIPVISTLAVGFVLYTFIKFALELALRQLKLAFLQIIAPFIIVDYMLKPWDDDTLKKWINTTVSTYLIIFLRVLTVWIIGLLAYYLRNGIPDDLGGSVSLLNSSDPLIKCLVILAAFAFLKDLPKLFSELTGYNLQENETINGIMQKGVSVVKGFAMAKVGSSIAKEQLLVTGGAQAISSAAGGVVEGMVAKKKGMDPKTSFAKGLSAGAENLSPMMGGFASAMHASVPIQGLNSAVGVSAYSGPPRDLTKGLERSKEETDQQKQQRKEKHAKNEVVNNLKTDLTNSAYDKSNNTFDFTQQIMGPSGANITFDQHVANNINDSLANKKANSYMGEQMSVSAADISAAISQINGGRDSANQIQANQVSEADFKQIIDVAITACKGRIANTKAVDNSGSSGK